MRIFAINRFVVLPSVCGVLLLTGMLVAAPPAAASDALIAELEAPLPKISPEIDLVAALRGVLLTDEPDLTRAGKRVLSNELSDREQKSLRQVQERLSEAVRSLDCWWQHGLPKEHLCADELQLLATLAEFDPVLARYEKAIARSQSSVSMDSWRELMDLNRLVFARIGWLASRGDRDKALRLWQQNQAALARLRKAGGIAVPSIMVTLSENYSLEALESLLARAPTLAKEDRKVIDELLADRAWTRERLIADLRAQYWLVADLARSQLKGDDELFVSEVLKRQVAYSVDVLPLLLTREDDFQSARALHRSIECPNSTVTSCWKQKTSDRRYAEFYFSSLSIEGVASAQRRDVAAHLLRLRLQWDAVGRHAAAFAKLVEDFNRASPDSRVILDPEQASIRFEDPSRSRLVVRLPR